MADLNLLLEAEKRGILPSDKKALLDEARKRGLVPPLQNSRLTGRQGMPTSDTALTPDVLKYRNQKSGLLPFSTDDRGNMRFDIHAGITGAILDAVTLPGDVAPNMNPIYKTPGAGKTSIWAADDSGKAVLSPEVLDRSAGLAAIGMPTSPALRSIAAAPTTEALKARANTAYEAAKSSNLTVTPNAMLDIATSISDDAAKAGIDKTLHPKAMAALKRIEDAIGSSPSLQQLDIYRQIIGDAAKSADAGERRIAKIMMRRLDDAIENLKPADVAAAQPGNLSLTISGKQQRLFGENLPPDKPYVVFDTRQTAGHEAAFATEVEAQRYIAQQGERGRHLDFASPKDMGEMPIANRNAGQNPLDAIPALKEARAAWARMRKAQTIETAQIKAERGAAASGSGGNINNRIRQEVKNILNSPSKMRGFTADEKALMEKVVAGSPVQNLLRLVGKLSPEGNGLMQSITLLGGYGTSGASLPFHAAGFAAKRAADAMTERNMRLLLNAVQSGGVKISQLPMKTRQALEIFMRSAGESAAQPQ